MQAEPPTLWSKIGLGPVLRKEGVRDALNEATCPPQTGADLPDGENLRLPTQCDEKPQDEDWH